MLTQREMVILLPRVLFLFSVCIDFKKKCTGYLLSGVFLKKGIQMIHLSMLKLLNSDASLISILVFGIAILVALFIES